MTSPALVQPFPALDSATEAALRASIERFGVLVPVVHDQDGRILDGHHRSRLADQLGIPYRVDVREVASDDEAQEIARTLNADRRHLRPEQRRPIVKALREDGHSLRAIGGALGISQTQVANDLEGVNRLTPDRVEGQDGKSYPASRPSPESAVPKRGYRSAGAKDTPFEVTNERARLVAEANKQRLATGLSEINGLLRGLLALDFGIVNAGLTQDEARVWAAKAAEHARSLKQLERKIKEAAAHGS